jgi:hypothetical protein
MDRANQFVKNFTVNPISIPLTLVGGGAGKAPVLGEGDIGAAYFTQPVFTSTGIWTLTTVDPYPAFQGFTGGFMQALGAGTVPVPSAGVAVNSWTFTFNVFLITAGTGGGIAAYDMLTGDRFYLTLNFRNSSSSNPNG